MDNVVNFPAATDSQSTPATSTREEIIKANQAYVNAFLDRMGLEVGAIMERIPQATELACATHKVAYAIRDAVVDGFSQEDPARIIESILQSINVVANGGVLCPIYGDENEWEEATVQEDIGKTLNINFRGQPVSLKIESLQINKRFPKIFRYNGDNNTAHRIDLISFSDVQTQQVFTNDESVRFIQLPYEVRSIAVPVVVTDGEITAISNGYNASLSDPEGIREVLDQVVYPMDKEGNVLIASKIPLNMLKEFGISIEKETETLNAKVAEVIAAQAGASMNACSCGDDCKCSDGECRCGDDCKCSDGEGDSGEIPTPTEE